MLFRLEIQSYNSLSGSIESTNREMVAKFLGEFQRENALVTIDLTVRATSPSEINALLGIDETDTRSIRTGMKL